MIMDKGWKNPEGWTRLVLLFAGLWVTFAVLTTMRRSFETDYVHSGRALTFATNFDAQTALEHYQRVDGANCLTPAKATIDRKAVGYSPDKYATELARLSRQSGPSDMWTRVIDEAAAEERATTFGWAISGTSCLQPAGILARSILLSIAILSPWLVAAGLLVLAMAASATFLAVAPAGQWIARGFGIQFKPSLARRMFATAFNTFREYTRSNSLKNAAICTGFCLIIVWILPPLRYGNLQSPIFDKVLVAAISSLFLAVVAFAWSLIKRLR